jgi:hypothetical protein
MSESGRRKRRLLEKCLWLLAGVALLVWLVSGRVSYVLVVSKSAVVVIVSGDVIFAWETPADHPVDVVGIYSSWPRFHKNGWLPSPWPWWHRYQGMTTAGVPLWLVAAPAIVGAWIIRRHTRAPTGERMCGHCGYDSTGNVSGRCPECGEQVSRRGESAASIDPTER